MVSRPAADHTLPIEADDSTLSSSRPRVSEPESQFGHRPPSNATWEQRRVTDTQFIRTLREQRLSAADPAIYLAYRCLLEQFEALLAEEPRAQDGKDSEGVHQMRVATRRLRAAFRVLKGVLPAQSAGSLNREFRWVAAVLGEVRDLDVYQDNLERYAAEIPAGDAIHLMDYEHHLRGQWRGARKQLLACLASRRYQRLKARFARFLERGPSRRILKEFQAFTIADAARQLIGERYECVRRDGRAITPHSPDESFHALRIQCKRLRYLFEFFDNSYGGLLQPYIKRSRRLQDVLGEIQDARVATEQLLQYAGQVHMRTKNRGQFIALGQLISGQHSQAATKRADFPEVWKRFDRRRAGRAILAVLGETRSTSNELDMRGRENDEIQTTTPVEPDSVKYGFVPPSVATSRSKRQGLESFVSTAPEGSPSSNAVSFTDLILTNTPPLNR